MKSYKEFVNEKSKSVLAPKEICEGFIKAFESRLSAKEWAEDLDCSEFGVVKMDNWDREEFYFEDRDLSEKEVKKNIDALVKKAVDTVAKSDKRIVNHDYSFTFSGMENIGTEYGTDVQVTATFRYI